MSTPSLKPKLESRFLIVGTVRNCRKHLEKDILRIEAALGDVAQLNWFLVESDSTDGTVGLLKALEKKRPNFRFVSLGRVRKQIRLRTARLAHCRNRYVEELRTHPDYVNVDYVIVADLDGLNDKLSSDAIDSCWTRDDWDMCAANQSAVYYDIYALRHPEWCPQDIARKRKFLSQYRKSYVMNYLATNWGLKIHIPPTSDWIEIHSAFGGFAIYKRWAFDDGAYVGITETGNRVCEHVSLHASMRDRGGRLFINPALINAHRTEHSAPIFWKIVVPNKWKPFVRKRLKFNC